VSSRLVLTMVGHVIHMNAAYHTYACVMSHIWLCHVTHVTASSHTYDCVKSHVCMHYVTHMTASCHTYDCVMSHIGLRHVTHITASCHTCDCVMSHIVGATPRIVFSFKSVSTKEPNISANSDIHFCLTALYLKKLANSNVHWMPKIHHHPWIISEITSEETLGVPYESTHSFLAVTFIVMSESNPCCDAWGSANCIYGAVQGFPMKVTWYRNMDWIRVSRGWNCVHAAIQEFPRKVTWYRNMDWIRVSRGWNCIHLAVQEFPMKVTWYRNMDWIWSSRWKWPWLDREPLCSLWTWPLVSQHRLNSIIVDESDRDLIGNSCIPYESDLWYHNMDRIRVSRWWDGIHVAIQGFPMKVTSGTATWIQFACHYDWIRVAITETNSLKTVAAHWDCCVHVCGVAHKKYRSLLQKSTIKETIFCRKDLY